LADVKITPYSFYEIGKVWNEDSGAHGLSAASFGLGAKFRLFSSFSGNAGIAWPLTKEVATPVYGDSQDPRFLLEMNISF
jgi:hemolysin activation/secretion protein